MCSNRLQQLQQSAIKTGLILKISNDCFLETAVGGRTQFYLKTAINMNQVPFSFTWNR